MRLVVSPDHQEACPLRSLVLSLAGLVLVQIACSCAKKGAEAPQPAPNPVAEAVPASAAGRVSRLASPEARAAAEPATKAEPTKRRAELAQCSWNLMAVVTALAKYMDDHGGKLPKVKSASELPDLLASHLEAEGSPTLDCPETGEPYLYNTALGGREQYSVRHEIVLRDSKPHANGEIGASWVDGTGTGGKPDDARLTKGTFR